MARAALAVWRADEAVLEAILVVGMVMMVRWDEERIQMSVKEG
jgi:hypothetical protein